MGSISLDTLVLAKKYTDKVLTGLGALKGSPCTLKATKENDDGSITVTFAWTGSDGVEETQDVIIPAGPQGEKGIQGEKGTDGVSPTVTITESTGRHTISFSDKDGVKSITIKDGLPEDMANYYTKDETDEKLNLKANTSDIPIIPTNLSELNNDENYIKNTAENLTNYYKKTETYSQTEVNTLLANINKLTSKIVTELPSENISESTIYLIEVENQKNVYMQYMYINGSFAALGTTAIDLSNVYTKGEVDKKLEEKADKTEIPTIPTLISSFTNDKGYITEFTETDPTVPAWAKEKNKPSYTAAEVGALPDDTEIPIFINKTVLDGITAEKVENWDEAVETKTNLEAHTNNMISSKTGVHGMRYFNGTLQVQNAEGDWFDVISGGGDSSNIHQLSFLNVRTNDVKYLNLDVGNVFTKSLIQAYKFIPGQTNIVETLKSFNNADASNFNYNDENVEFTDKGMGIKDTYKLTMSKYNDELYITEAFNKDDFVDINSIVLRRLNL